MSTIQDYLGNLRSERSKMVERAAASNDLVANIKGIAQLQLAIIAVSAVAAEKMLPTILMRRCQSSS